MILMGRMTFSFHWPGDDDINVSIMLGRHLYTKVYILRYSACRNSTVHIMSYGAHMLTCRESSVLALAVHRRCV